MAYDNNYWGVVFLPRPFKCRRVRDLPNIKVFKPGGVSLGSLEVVNLNVDEYEAIRLADLEGKYHEDAAKNMNVSRQTFGNILDSGRKKIADSIVNAKAILIEGGNVCTVTEKCLGRRNRCRRRRNNETLYAD